MEPDDRNVYPENLAVFAYRHGAPADGGRDERAADSPASTLDDADGGQATFGVDLSGKAAGLAGKSFTIAAILGLTPAEEDAVNLSVQRRLHHGRRHLQNYLYVGAHDVRGLADGFGGNVPVVRQGRPATAVPVYVR
ncbi:hypothetical protein EVAR_85483_1 [Eumeta japonica]|uniref:Uncharacterized protein n=1 Tax=Eumeta variegata TaxID=151549 RepID=A0A4C1VBS9_EUMVA|nr:hypothetical protein EVAR_85483_1 [Eumeta japonica]